MTERTWKTVTGAAPCPICGRPDWCGTSGEVVRCMRAPESAPAGWREIKTNDDGGVVFGPASAAGRQPRRKRESTGRDLDQEAERYIEAIDDQLLDELAGTLGVSGDSLRQVRCGWSSAINAWMFPEKDANGRVVGFVRRYRNGAKLSGAGEHRGLCVPADFAQFEGLILIVEGPTDVAACIDMGLRAVGRPSNTGGAALLAEFLRDREIIIVGENDQKEDGKWPGRDGATRIALRLATEWNRSVRWALPPEGFKDARAYLNHFDGDPREAGARLLDHLQETAETIKPEDVPIKFEIDRQPGRKRATITAKRGDRVLDVDSFDPEIAARRARFAQQVAAQNDGDTKVLGDNLLKLVSELDAEEEEDRENQTRSASDLLTAYDDQVAERLDQMNPAIVEEATAMLSDPRLVTRILDDIAAAGVVDERCLALTTYVIGTSRQLSKPLAAVVQGTTSSGKSFVLETVASHFPDEAVLLATDISPNALYYAPPGRLQHRWVVAGERSRIQNDERAEATRALREMISSGRLHKFVTIKLDGKMQSVEIVQDGPIAFIESTTLTTIFPEDANRALLLSTDETPEQTRRIVSAIARNATESSPRQQRFIQRHHALQRMLKRCPVVIPYAERIGEFMPSERPEARRTIGHTLNFIAAITLLHQRQRAGHPLEHGEEITASLEDYAIACLLLNGPLGRAIGGGLPDAVVRFGQSIRNHFGDEQFTTTQARNSNLTVTSSGHVSGHLNTLAEAGVVEVVQANRGNQPAVWRFVRDVPEGGALWLPTVQQLDPNWTSKVAIPVLKIARPHAAEEEATCTS